MGYKIFDRKFGFELETSTEMETIEKVLAGVIPSNRLCRTTGASGFGKWKLEYDYTTESEIVSPVLTMADLPEVKTLLEGLKNHKVSLTRNDSMHLHMYAGDISREHMVVAWMTIESVLKKCFPLHRRKAEYAEPLMTTRSRNRMVSSYYKDAEQKSSEHKSAISFEHLDDRNRHTVEFRLFEGTLKYENVENWVKFCHLFLNYSKKIKFVDKITEKTNILRSLDEMFVELKIEKYKKICRWLENRHEIYK